MKVIYDMKVRVKLLLGFGILLLFMGGIGYTGYRSVTTIEHDLQNIFTIQMPSIDSLLEADRDLQQLLVAERSMIFTDPESKLFQDFVKDYNANLEQSETRWKAYKKLASSEKEKELFAGYDKARSEWMVSSQKVVELAKKNDEASAKQAKELTLGETNNHFERM